MFKKLILIIKIFSFYFLSINTSFADLQNNLINKLTKIQTLTFDFRQKIADKEEVGICYIKYPLMMKCNYENHKKKTIISNGKTVAIIKKKYKKVYLYPIKSTPLIFILKKEKIINLIKNSNPDEIDKNLISYKFVDKKKNIVSIIFDKKSLNLRGWETKDAYSNNVIFEINNLVINNQIVDNFFRIPREENL